MKRIIISAAIAMSATAAYAEPVTVMAPKAGATAEESAAYVAKLEKAVKQVCQAAASPVIGLNYYTYMSCLKQTRADVGRQDPTGLFAQRDSTRDLARGTVVAAN
jgi:hypothetical protein